MFTFTAGRNHTPKSRTNEMIEANTKKPIHFARKVVFFLAHPFNFIAFKYVILSTQIPLCQLNGQLN
jgi:hypothetical protein